MAMKIKTSKSERIFHAINYVVLTFLCGVCLYPLVYTISMSLSDPLAAARGDVILWPVGWSTESYEYLFSNVTMWKSYGNTLFYVVGVVLYGLTLMFLYAYPLSRKEFTFKKFFTIVMVITMFIGGGMIPFFILYCNLGLYNTRIGIILTTGFGTYNVVMIRTFLQTNIPDEMIESARIDGSGELNTLLRVVLPLSKPIIAVMVLFLAVGQWNSFFSHVLYQADTSLHPLQVYLRNVLMLGQTAVDDPAASTQDIAYVVMQMKYALIIFSLVPILCLYPFIQKYFTKGVMLGALKG